MHVRGNMVHHVELPLNSDEVTYLDIEDLLCMFEEHVCNLVELLLPSDGYNVIPRSYCMCVRGTSIQLGRTGPAYRGAHF
jgi:hypothetical protein